MNEKTLSKAIVFPKAGHFRLQMFKPDNTLDGDKIYSSQHQIVKSVKRATTLTTSPLPDGNSVYEAHEYVTKEETVITVGFSTYDPFLEAFVKDAEYTEGTAEKAIFYRPIETTIPESAALELPDAASDANKDIVVRDRFGNAFTEADAAAAGKYQTETDAATQKVTLKFDASDVGKEIFLVYASSVSGVTSIGYSEKPKNAAMQMIIMGEAASYDESQTVLTNIIVDKVTLNGGLTPPDQSNDPTQGWELAFKTGKPRAGKKPVEIKFLDQ